VPNVAKQATTLFIASAIAVVTLVTGAEAGVTKQPSFFNSQEIEYTSHSNLQKWQGLLVKHEEAGLQGAAAAERNAIIEENKDRPLSEQIDAVNREINRFYYEEDAAQYGRVDYWASPAEFFARGAGDCEDFAIAKYMLLKAMGVDEDAMRIVVLEQANGIGHAVLVVDSEDGQMVLDNQSGKAELASAINDYRPIYSVNGNAWWMHVAN